MNTQSFIPVFILVLLLPLFSCAQNQDPFHVQRNRMVNTQIEARGITDEDILKAFREVERHKFVLPGYIESAYKDTPLPIDEGQTISQPYVVAFMTDVLNLKRTDKVLEVGTGSGYQAAILAELCDSVFTIELFETLGNKAREVFNQLGYENIISKIGDGYQGWPEYAPFDAIVVTAAPAEIPKPLQNQLAEGGRMIIPVGSGSVQNLVLLEKRNGEISKKQILPVRFVPLIDSEGKKY